MLHREKGGEKVFTWGKDEAIPILMAATFPTKYHNVREGRGSEYVVGREEKNETIILESEKLELLQKNSTNNY